jgi:hypothetical protein
MKWSVAFRDFRAGSKTFAEVPHENVCLPLYISAYLKLKICIYILLLLQRVNLLQRGTLRLPTQTVSAGQELLQEWYLFPRKSKTNVFACELEVNCRYLKSLGIDNFYEREATNLQVNRND